MSEQTTQRAFYVTGGTLKPDAPSYVERPADGELWRQLQEGEYCYVLTSRQMGKSSLMARTAKRLRDAGDKAAIVDLTQIGSARGEGSAESWYLGVLHAVHRGLKPASAFKTWWLDNAELSPVQRFVEYFRQVALPEGDERRVVFVDEIDSTIGLPFADDFFAAIRACYNACAEDETFARLSFVLLGVATPDQLIDDLERTPFNVGRRVELTDFTVEEARRLAAGLGGEHGEEILSRILHWTGGQPYLTQVLCQLMAESGAEDEGAVDRLVAEHFLSERALREETHLRHVRARLGGKDGDARRRLKLYRRILRGKPVSDEPTSPIMAALKLSGVVRLRDDGTLAPRNRLYDRVFTVAWARREMPVDRARITFYGSLSVMAVAFFFWYAIFQPRPYVEQLALASEDYAVAEAAYEGLRANPFARFRANELLAQFWDRRARKAALREDRDRTLLAWLQALRTVEGDRRRREVGHWIGASYRSLQATLRQGGAVNAVTFSPDGEMVLSGSANGTARLWNSASGATIGQSMQHEDQIRAVSFSPDGQSVVTGSDDGTARLWSAANGAAIGPSMRHGSSVSVVAFSPDGEAVVTAGGVTARLWSAASGSEIGSPMRDETSILAAIFSLDGQSMLTGSDDGTVRLWSVASGSAIGPPMRYWDSIGQPVRHEDSVVAVAFSPDRQTVVTGDHRGTARLWSIANSAEIGQTIRHEFEVGAVVFSPDGQTVVTGSADGTARSWSVASGAAIGQSMRHEAEVGAVAFSLDGQTVVTGSADRTARLWSAASGTAIGPPLQHGAFVRTVAFSPDGKTVVTTSAYDRARLWNVVSGAAIGRPLQHREPVRGVALSPDGKTVVTGSGDSTARLWSVESGEEIGQPLQHETSVAAVAFSPDGKTVVTGSSDSTARLWSAESGAAIGQPMQHEFVVIALAFSPDGQMVLTGSADGTTRLWSAETGSAIGQPVRHKGWGLTVGYSPDGETVVTSTLYRIHVHAVTASGLEHVASHFVGTGWTGVNRFTEACPDCLDIAVRPTANSLRIDTIHLREPDGPPIEGDPEELLEEWQRRLALVFDEQMNLVPRWPIPGSARLGQQPR